MGAWVGSMLSITWYVALFLFIVAHQLPKPVPCVRALWRHLVTPGNHLVTPGNHDAHQAQCDQVLAAPQSVWSLPKIFGVINYPFCSNGQIVTGARGDVPPAPICDLGNKAVLYATGESYSS
jgi:hypothetical protein